MLTDIYMIDNTHFLKHNLHPFLDKLWRYFCYLCESVYILYIIMTWIHFKKWNCVVEMSVSWIFAIITWLVASCGKLWQIVAFSMTQGCRCIANWLFFTPIDHKKRHIANTTPKIANHTFPETFLFSLHYRSNLANLSFFYIKFSIFFRAVARIIWNNNFWSHMRAKKK